jgi:hypothetical protein
LIYEFAGTKAARIVKSGKEHGGTPEEGSGTSDCKEE